jgi:hypothetical protein
MTPSAIAGIVVCVLVVGLFVLFAWFTARERKRITGK